MPTRGQSASAVQPNHKRQRQSPEHEVSAAKDQAGSPDNTSNGTAAAGDAKVTPGQSPMFRNVSACNRCRLRKNRCDQNLPSCASCTKANVDCMGFDPITKKNIPRSYVFYLETRVQKLEEILSANNISYPPAQFLQLSSRARADGQRVASATDTGIPTASDAGTHNMTLASNAALGPLKGKKDDRSPAMLNLAAKPRSLASTSGVSFARVVWAAIQHSSSDPNPAPEHNTNAAGTSMRDSFFGLHTKPTIQRAPFPDKSFGLTLVDLYFEHANPQIPILHRPEFMSMFQRAYKDSPESLTARELYMLNMVFAIGKGVIVEDNAKTTTSTPDAHSTKAQQPKPEQYHASAIVHLEACLSQSGGYLEVLQAVLLLANFALLRPVPPGLWYITGVAMRLAVDLGLHHEDGLEVESALPDPPPGEERQEPDRGKRMWYRDLKRRLWWCTYSIDRLVSMCVGRPCGISDQVITTELPSLLDDSFITTSGFVDPQNGVSQTSYKHVAHHYFRLRLLQSEILQVLQYNQAEMVRQASQGLIYPEMHKHLPSPYLIRYDSFRSWRDDIDRRLLHWKESAPSKEQTGVDFDLEFLELNYWQAILMLYRQSLSVPAMFEGEYTTSDEVNSPTTHMAEMREDEDRVYVKVAEAGRKILRIYRSLHRSALVSHTYLSTHHLFTAGISYLYAIWHSPLVRSKLMINDVDFTVLGAKSVFTDMIDKCPPAETCRDAFDRTAKATIKMVNQNGGFGTAVATNNSSSTPTQRQRRETTTWITTQRPDATTLAFPTRHRHNLSEQQSFPFDFSISDNLSSPGMSVAGELSSSQATPPVTRSNMSDADAIMSDTRSHADTTHIDGSVKQEESVGRNSISSPPVPGPVSGQSAAADSAFPFQSFGPPSAGMDYPDSQTLDFLSTLEGSTNGEFNNIEPTQMDFGFGINWEGVHGDYSDNQQVHPFDTFFFGGSGAAGGGGAGGNGAGGNSG